MVIIYGFILSILPDSFKTILNRYSIRLYGLSGGRILYGVLAVLGIMPVVFLVHSAFAQNCIELGSCDLSQQPFDLFLQPYLLTIGSWFYIMAWGIIIIIIYMRSTPINAGVAGLILAATFTGSSFATEFKVFGEALRLGILLFAIAISFMAWTVFKSRIQGNG